MSTSTAMVTEPGALDSLLAALALPPGSSAPTQPHWLKALRAQALERVSTLTLPSTHDEAWRFTPLAAFARQSFHPLRTPTTLQPDDIAHLHIAEATTRLVFVDGVHAPQLSSVKPDAALAVGTLAAMLSTHAATLQAHLGQQVAGHGAFFAALNTAFLQDAAVLVVPPDSSLGAPVHLLFISTQPEVASHPRLLLVVGAAAKATVIEDYVALIEGTNFTNAVAEVVVGANAQLEHVRLQRESKQGFHMASCAVSLAAASRYHSVNIALGGQISRLDLKVTQTFDGSECTLDGLALIDGEQLADTHTFIDHAKPHGTSRQLHKCIVGGTAHAVFNGQVMVRPGAQKTDSAQSSRNLLLSSRAQVDTQPQLEIFADDVKCTHGATVGQLDSDEVFYLQSRGLSERVARNLLTYAFGAEVINRIPVASLRQQLEQTVLEQTTGQP
ncbi:MAG: Fe-S cluster assembly protein SufD [Gammaproteobacteria bacterium]|uniref:Fe-S cluster assembly protein SufD n=1 Tax=Rhodoferax sp. TaxID=50421 RepID=UPI0017D2FB04|nr:Fe-S cluster assembly protein SufD [Rhodoferax sp.]MBU3899914.1 Fe-S cluster assembly protein SufD [Gammaproteobacteria bacterium]MBA3057298.1 Fe-S cluster assembly protein SufD [Rhodoferax sp.]MBU3998603.1 Fe-S cluster assembly protein SufD [Gammaproteobacteria bacterium]MBU4019180.1 Fe-S cluster assembly protein SufD [Gammaproteobacteria bacterium]MBU4078898.1 Fe-S cluster assembly protein SufD [Gammaproteobacteria bacterium]